MRVDHGTTYAPSYRIQGLWCRHQCLSEHSFRAPASKGPDSNPSLTGIIAGVHGMFPRSNQGGSGTFQWEDVMFLLWELTDGMLLNENTPCFGRTWMASLNAKEPHHHVKSQQLTVFAGLIQVLLHADECTVKPMGVTHLTWHSERFADAATIIWNSSECVLGLVW